MRQEHYIITSKDTNMEVLEHLSTVSPGNSPTTDEDTVDEDTNIRLDKCMVIGHEDGTGKYRGMCGALICEYRGKMFKVVSGLTDDDRHKPPKMGSTIIFSYLEQAGVPRHPTFKSRHVC